MSAERREFVQWRNDSNAAEAHRAAEHFFNDEAEERPRRPRRQRYYAPGDPEAPEEPEATDE